MASRFDFRKSLREFLKLDGSRAMTGDLPVDVIKEATADAGVTIDGIKLKDSAFLYFRACRLYDDGSDRLYLTNFAGDAFMNMVLGETTMYKGWVYNRNVDGLKAYFRIPKAGTWDWVDVMHLVCAADPYVEIPFAGDITFLTGKKLKWDNLELHEYDANTLLLQNHSAVKQNLHLNNLDGQFLYCDYIKPRSTLMYWSHDSGQEIWAKSHDGAVLQTVFKLKAGYMDVLRLGDVTLLDDKMIQLSDETTGAAANAANRGKLRFIHGAAGSRDRVYQCMKSDADAYSWVEIANGGA